MNDFPRMLFRCPGSEPMHGGHFATRIVADADEQASALADGWHLTTPEAKAAHEAPSNESDVNGRERTETDEPPTRAELEQKAAELGIAFDGRTSDKKLGEKIAAALKG